MSALYRVLSLSLLSAIFTAGCLGGSSNEPTTDEVDQQLSDSWLDITYYSDSSKTVEVGHCWGPSACTGPSKTCIGQITSFYDTELIACYE